MHKFNNISDSVLKRNKISKVRYSKFLKFKNNENRTEIDMKIVIIYVDH